MQPAITFSHGASPSTPTESSSPRPPAWAVCVTDWSFSFRCSPPRLAATQLRSDTARLFTAQKPTSTAPSQRLLRRTSADCPQSAAQRRYHDCGGSLRFPCGKRGGSENCGAYRVGGALRAGQLAVRKKQKKPPRRSRSGVVKCILVGASLPRLPRYLRRRNRSSETGQTNGGHANEIHSFSPFACPPARPTPACRVRELFNSIVISGINKHHHRQVKFPREKHRAWAGSRVCDKW